MEGARQIFDLPPVQFFPPMGCLKSVATSDTQYATFYPQLLVSVRGWAGVLKRQQGLETGPASR